MIVVLNAPFPCMIFPCSGIILRSQLANFSQFWSKFCHPLDQCKSDEKSLHAGGFWQAFLLDCLFSTNSLWSCHFSRIFARPEWSLVLLQPPAINEEPIPYIKLYFSLTYISISSNWGLSTCHPRTETHQTCRAATWISSCLGRGRNILDVQTFQSWWHWTGTDLFLQ